jgi:hypothetical protein
MKKSMSTIVVLLAIPIKAWYREPAAYSYRPFQGRSTGLPGERPL